MWQIIQDLAADRPPDPVTLAASVANKRADKHDCYLSDDLLDVSYAARSLDVPRAWETLRQLARAPCPDPNAILQPSP